MFSITSQLDILWRRRDNKYILIFVFLTALFLITRLYHLLALPIFSDEGIYIQWAKMAAQDGGMRFVSLTDGRQPLQTWALMPLVKLFPSNLLLALRSLSVFGGFVGFLGIGVLIRYLFDKRASIIGMLLYICVPYFLFYDRIGLIDTWVSAAAIWTLLLTFILFRTHRLDVALLMGLVSGIFLLAKSSVMLFLILATCAPIMYLKEWKNPKQFSKKVIDYLVLMGIVIVIAYGMYSIQRLSPFYHNIALKNYTFIDQPLTIILNPFKNVFNNLKVAPLYLAWESGWVLTVCAIIGSALLIRDKKILGAYLVFWIIAPFTIILFFNFVLYPRYLLFIATLSIIPATYFLSILSPRYRNIVIIPVFAILTYLSLPIVTDVRNISLPAIDKGQYIEGATAVWGAPELMDIIRESTQDEKRALVLAEGNFGLIADVLTAYIKPDDRIDVRGLWPLNESDIVTAQLETADKHVFVVFPHRNDFPIHWQQNLIEEVKVFDKPNGSPDKVYLFRVRPPVSPR